jgi:hypothetical protein
MTKAETDMQGTSKVVVVVPFYKPTVTEREKVSLLRCRDVLENHPRILVGPRCTDVTEYLNLDPNLAIVRLDDRHFTSLMAYSALCCMPEFYEPFLEYEYMLLYQLDCYVFRDQLLYWCEQGYDYIGAPWPDYEHMTESRKWIARLPFIRWVLKRAGQGGFSLRRVQTCHRVAARLARLTFLIQNYPEDVLWTTIGSRLCWRFRLAGFSDALQFSFDASPAQCYLLNGDRLPFGCHGWHTQPKFWHDKIPDFPESLKGV